MRDLYYLPLNLSSPKTLAEATLPELPQLGHQRQYSSAWLSWDIHTAWEPWTTYLPYKEIWLPWSHCAKKILWRKCTELERCQEPQLFQLPAVWVFSAQAPHTWQLREQASFLVTAVPRLYTAPSWHQVEQEDLTMPSPARTVDL